jgi:DNA invertase Pin-like site-specific DNA recombinase
LRTERISSKLVKDLYELGYSTNDIARVFDASSGQIWKKLNKMGIDMSISNRPLTRVTDFSDELYKSFEEVGISFVKLLEMEHRKDNLGKQLERDVRNNEILRLRSLGLSYADISNTLKCGIGTVSRVVKSEETRVKSELFSGSE